MTGAQRRGAYGLAVLGLEAYGDLLVPAPRPVAAAALEVAGSGSSRPRPMITNVQAVYPLQDGGHVIVERAGGTATFVTPTPPPPDRLLHPRLGMIGSVCAGWLGSDAFHAGGFVQRGRAWAVVGDGYHGKSTLLAALHSVGVPIVTDDTLIIRDGVCLSGVRCIDLRDDAPERLGVANHVSPSRVGQRRRLPTGPPPPGTSLGGWVFLRWDDEVALERIPGSRASAADRPAARLASPGRGGSGQPTRGSPPCRPGSSGGRAPGRSCLRSSWC